MVWNGGGEEKKRKEKKREGEMTRWGKERKGGKERMVGWVGGRRRGRLGGR